MEWIWTENQTESGYAEFYREFLATGEKVELLLSSDRQFAAFVNGKFAANGQYADPYGQRSYIKKDVTKLVQKGVNRLDVIAVHSEHDFAQGRVTEAGVCFQILVDGKETACSDENTFARVSPKYSVSDPVTPQIGYGYGYDFTKDSAWGKACLSKGYPLVERPIKSCNILPPAPVEVVAQGIFQYRDGNTIAERAQNAWLSSFRFADMTGVNRVDAAKLNAPLTFQAEGGDGVFVLVDMLRETAGYLSLSIEVDKPCKGIVVWGEHLTDLRVRAAVGWRNFAAPFTFRKGKNQMEEYLHRLGGRYLCLFVENAKVKVERLTVRPAEYPFHIIERKIEDRLLKKIYDTGVRTLQLCAHEHYEDCPWREQAFYAMDARNQALYGYSAFGEYEFPRAGFRLITQSLREDGMPELCTPARARFTIPSYAPYWIIAVKENAELDFRPDFIAEMFPFVQRIMQAFEERTAEWGVSAFHEKEYWNFHEWSEGMEGDPFNRDYDVAPYGDGMLTALVIMAAQCTAFLAEKLGKTELVQKYQAYADKLGACLEKYYNEETGLYATNIKEGKQMGCHGCVLAAYALTGYVPKDRAQRICKELKTPEKSVPMTFGELQFKYEAILRIDGDREFCIDDACEVYSKMLFAGATSFWETEKGEADFNDGGSLCHAWASVVCWLFDKLGVAKAV